MTQDEIIRSPIGREQLVALAREAGLIRQRGNLDIVTHSITQIERFAALVAANEREACAKVCDEVEMRFGRDGDDLEQYGANQCAAAIRARGENGTA